MVKGRGIGMLGGASESFFLGCGALAAAALVWALEVPSLCASARAPQAIGGQLSVAASGARLAAPRD